MNRLKTKSIKDAIHGYIRLDEPYWKVVDTAEFQRLKWIEQTSYRVLYPAARHDRFIHSIGVYHLGQKAICGFLKNCSEEESILVKKHKNSFMMACLLHDIGHAPFSHTCEDLYSYKEKISDFDSKINQELLNEIKSHHVSTDIHIAFEGDFKYILKEQPPSPHEIMSSIVTCKNFGVFSSFFSNDEGIKTELDLDLIVRSILGCCYAASRLDNEVINKEKGIKNCLIRLLNSSTVDVDKLDYIARDTQMSGYDNIVIDTERLLDNVCIVSKDNIYYPAFKKGALSVVNNVILAKNAQAKWIVNHPVVLYEAYILRRAIGEALKNLKISKIDSETKNLTLDELIYLVFSSSSLSKNGNCYSTGTFSLLSDIEILNIMKNSITNSYVSEYFTRYERKSPIWKSHEEYLFWLHSEENAEMVADYMAPLVTYFNDIEDISHPKQIDKKFLDDIIASNAVDNSIQSIVQVLLGYNPYPGFNEGLTYVVLAAKSNFFTTIDSKKLNIKFSDCFTDFDTYEKLYKYDKSKPSYNYQFYYLYCNKKIDTKDFLDYLNEKSKAKEVRI